MVGRYSEVKCSGACKYGWRVGLFAAESHDYRIATKSRSWRLELRVYVTGKQSVWLKFLVSTVCCSQFVADSAMDSLLDEQLWSNLLGYLAEDTSFYQEDPIGDLVSYRLIDSYLCLRCASVRLCGIVTGPPLLEALEYAISYGDFEEDCRRYQCILDSGWIHQVYPCHSLADSIRRTAGISGGGDPVHR